MNTLDELESAIRHLSPGDRERLLERLSRDIDNDRIGEPRASYEKAVPVHLSVDEYLRFEEQAAVRHEYIGGAMYAMTGASRRHNVICGNVFAALHAHVRSRGCTAYMSDFKVRLEIERTDIFYYPDVMVGCGSEGVEDSHLRFPVLVIEVLSPSTQSIDRREKLLNYARIPSVEEYVLISQNRPEVTLHRRATCWAPQISAGRDALLELASIELATPLACVYEGALEPP